ncbi:MAG: hypothetical protein JXO72_12305 [Vicinamibacteria bacterium]|nr:hypothetical protein [Vicinamibacteria bacterium]
MTRWTKKREMPAAVFESYPSWAVALSNGLSLSIYALGSVIVARLGWGFLAAYLVFLAYLEVHLLARGCVHCTYYGRACFSGKGLVASWLFKRGDPSRFASRKFTWLSLLPDMLVVLIPLGAGLFLSIRRFDWLLLSLMVGLIILAFPGNGCVRGRLACRYCRQRELGCPAEELFRRRERERARSRGLTTQGCP